MIRTVGHGTLDADVFARLLQDAGVEILADVRRFPGSRRLPHFGKDAMPTWLAESGISYCWLSSLGGRRKPWPDSPHVGLRTAQFRAYADHMGSAEFRSGVENLLTVAAGRAVAVMCSESLWWRCHRRLLADHLVLVEGVGVEHLFHDGRLVAHPVTPEARCHEGGVLYDHDGGGTKPV